MRSRRWLGPVINRLLSERSGGGTPEDGAVCGRSPGKTRWRPSPPNLLHEPQSVARTDCKNTEYKV